MADFGVPVGTDAHLDKFAKALAIQFSCFVISTDADVNVDVWQIYQPLLIGEEITPDDIKGPRYAGDSAAVFSRKSIEANCYDSIRHEWKIQNRGTKEWHDCKLVLINQDEISPEILKAIIPIPDARPNETIKIATDINAGGFEGKFDCKWEMQDADGEDCFPNYRWEFNIQICVRFTEVGNE
ncbi:MAG: NBR1-Ig-like domain-containing protein [Alistipes sp.]|nr:NBR1-Ig-like domain-containing protein [Alistipes sp.]